MTAPSRHGIALLFVLIAVALVGSATAALLQSALRFESVGRQAREDCLRDGLRSAGESCALAWLKERSALTVLPPEGGGTTILDAGWVIDGVPVALRLVAYDRLGMLPFDLSTPGAPLQGAVAPVLRRSLLARQPPPPGTPDDLLTRIPCPSGWRRFPTTASGRRTDRCLAMLIAPDGDGRINLNTASAELIDEAFSVLRLDGTAQTLDRRQRGEISVPPDGWATTASGAANLGVRLVSASDRWSFLLVARVAGGVSGWWLVTVGNAEGGAIVLRHAVVD